MKAEASLNKTHVKVDNGNGVNQQFTCVSEYKGFCKEYYKKQATPVVHHTVPVVHHTVVPVAHPTVVPVVHPATVPVVTHHTTTPVVKPTTVVIHHVKTLPTKIVNGVANFAAPKSTKT